MEEDENEGKCDGEEEGTDEEEEEKDEEKDEDNEDMQDEEEAEKEEDEKAELGGAIGANGSERECIWGEDETKLDGDQRVSTRTAQRRETKTEPNMTENTRHWSKRKKSKKERTKSKRRRWLPGLIPLSHLPALST